MSENVIAFDCRMCGQCCEGRGGIVLSGSDLARLAAFLNKTESDTLFMFTEISNGKRKIRTGQNGKCVFFAEGAGCSVHEGKPDICRAWPFFRGNLIDENSFEMAREFCPGIDKTISFAAFVQSGLAYLEHNQLAQTIGRLEANALNINDIPCPPLD